MIEMSNICHPKLELLRLKIVEKLYATSNFKTSKRYYCPPLSRKLKAKICPGVEKSRKVARHESRFTTITLINND